MGVGGCVLEVRFTEGLESDGAEEGTGSGLELLRMNGSMDGFAFVVVLHFWCAS